MSLLIDKLAERHIQSALQKGELDHLQGSGQPLALEDWSLIPESLRVGYHLLKNAGYIPPELAQRQEALRLCELLTTVQNQADDGEVTDKLHQLHRLELKLRVQGIDTRFIHRYLRIIQQKNLR
ncbi:DnaJ family domain-containing protein [Vibrio mangrovi]|uniref:DnaJ family domain-containing protein n=1 Tax=Vibrio mangrovi TaxID=474394 RepID=A0A1Y6INR9_9VIBR|nr:DnaJ family domain-containing protein [Vibrio mangrovi]MDW6003902.1 DnaJ family domain-containing protein [Vibrio mangrovi]SMR99304.1 hypothetical protein VIM7927_00529 [Vibrio mangrovi]